MITTFIHTFETTSNLPALICIQHGETVKLISKFINNGIPVDLTGYSVEAIYQISSDSEHIYYATASISDNRVEVIFDNETDLGKPYYRLWIKLTKDNEVSYPAKYFIEMKESPDYSPNIEAE